MPEAAVFEELWKLFPISHKNNIDSDYFILYVLLNSRKRFIKRVYGVSNFHANPNSISVDLFNAQRMHLTVNAKREYCVITSHLLRFYAMLCYFYTTHTNLSTKYRIMYQVNSDVCGIKY